MSSRRRNRRTPQTPRNRVLTTTRQFSAPYNAPNIPRAEVHMMPFSIDYTGPARVKTFFHVTKHNTMPLQKPVDPKNDYYESFFRGRGVVGKKADLASHGVIGLVLGTNRGNKKTRNKCFNKKLITFPQIMHGAERALYRLRVQELHAVLRAAKRSARNPRGAQGGVVVSEEQRVLLQKEYNQRLRLCPKSAQPFFMGKNPTDLPRVTPTKITMTDKATGKKITLTKCKDDNKSVNNNNNNNNLLTLPHPTINTLRYKVLFPIFQNTILSHLYEQKIVKQFDAYLAQLYTQHTLNRPLPTANPDGYARRMVSDRYHNVYDLVQKLLVQYKQYVCFKAALPTKLLTKNKNNNKNNKKQLTPPPTPQPHSDATPIEYKTTPKKPAKKALKTSGDAMEAAPVDDDGEKKQKSVKRVNFAMTPETKSLPRVTPTGRKPSALRVPSATTTTTSSTTKTSTTPTTTKSHRNKPPHHRLPALSVAIPGHVGKINIKLNQDTMAAIQGVQKQLYLEHHYRNVHLSPDNLRRINHHVTLYQALVKCLQFVDGESCGAAGGEVLTRATILEMDGLTEMERAVLTKALNKAQKNKDTTNNNNNNNENNIGSSGEIDGPRALKKYVKQCIVKNNKKMYQTLIQDVVINPISQEPPQQQAQPPAELTTEMVTALSNAFAHNVNDNAILYHNNKVYMRRIIHKQLYQQILTQLTTTKHHTKKQQQHAAAAKEKLEQNQNLKLFLKPINPYRVKAIQYSGRMGRNNHTYVHAKHQDIYQKYQKFHFGHEMGLLRKYHRSKRATASIQKHLIPPPIDHKAVAKQKKEAEAKKKKAEEAAAELAKKNTYHNPYADFDDDLGALEMIDAMEAKRKEEEAFARRKKTLSEKYSLRFQSEHDFDIYGPDGTRSKNNVLRYRYGGSSRWTKLRFINNEDILQYLSFDRQKRKQMYYQFCRENNRPFDDHPLAAAQWELRSNVHIKNVVEDVIIWNRDDNRFTTDYRHELFTDYIPLQCAIHSIE